MILDSVAQQPQQEKLEVDSKLFTCMGIINML